MSQFNSGLALGLAGSVCGVVMAGLAVAMSRAPGWAELRSYALIALASAAYCLCDVVHVVHVGETTRMLGEHATLAACFLYAIAWIRHLAIADKRALRPPERVVIAVGLVMVALAFVPGALIAPPYRLIAIGWFGVTYTMATPTTLGVACVAFLLGGLFVAAFRGTARLPKIGAVALALAGASDTAASLDMIAMPQLTEAVSVVVVGGLGLSYARQFIAKLEQEVTDRTRMLLEAQAETARHERLAGLGRIAAGVAHEINNPTMVLQQNLDRIRELAEVDDELAPELRARLDRSRAATQRIADIARQLLETGRQPHGEGGADARTFALAGVVDKAIGAAIVAAPALHVTADVPGGLCGRGDPGALEQVLINLMVNAAHAAERAADGPRVRIAATRAGERVRIAVADNGPGIPAAMRERLFEPFSTTKPVGKGTGLGLAVSRGLMTRQGGSLEVAHSTSAGTEMTLELAAGDPADIAVPAQPERPTPVPRSELKILVIDDDDDVREVLQLQLGPFFHVDAAGTVDAALALVAAGQRYDVVLCDLVMPSGGAESWLARCATVDPRLDDRTILLTGGPTTASASELVEVRREKVLFKPVEVGVLRPMIERLSREPS